MLVIVAVTPVAPVSVNKVADFAPTLFAVKVTVVPLPLVVQPANDVFLTLVATAVASSPAATATFCAVPFKVIVMFPLVDAPVLNFTDAISTSSFFSIFSGTTL
ncbi:MAG: hypothetical protein BWX95_02749 [Bacteroidetes bacterium ADurb.Bin141]|nr:MAG: hypothetical protein BWX95_02749 [Bacteroidetes bacterium ADurb.Bin141]